MVKHMVKHMVKQVVKQVVKDMVKDGVKFMIMEEVLGQTKMARNSEANLSMPEAATKTV